MLKMMTLVKNAREAENGVEYFTAATTRLLSFFAHWRFLYFHGQKHARLERDKTVYDEPLRERTLLITLVSPLLFLAPEVHLRDLGKLWMDEIIIETVWRAFMAKLLEEWQDVVLWSTVMLTANVGFLAIPGVVITNLSGVAITSPSQLRILTSPAQLASSLSIQASIGSIVIGLLLLRHNRTKKKDGPAGAATYLSSSTHRRFGLEPLAITFSLPWALLMWSMVTFSIALLVLCFYISNMPTRMVIAVSTFTSAPPVIVCVVISWLTSDDGELWKNNLVVFKRSGVRLFVRPLKRLQQQITSHLPRLHNTHPAPQSPSIPMADRQNRA
ncbi:hypothetical protein BGW80DRAFT_1306583 [Lactifluus volemus]|nr:hypothetical protein BGW80DRAFT_1306583 [Lactifluus volemus]